MTGEADRGLRRRSVLGTAGSLGLGVTAGCLESVVGGGSDGGEPGATPDLLLLADGDTDGGNLHAATELLRLTPRDGDSGYRVAQRYIPTGGRRVTDACLLGDRTVTVESTQSGYRPSADGSELAVVDDTGERVATREVPGVPAVAIQHGSIYVAREDGFGIYDDDLEVVGLTRLPADSRGRHMEDVRLHDGVAYVVDDVVYPRYLFRVDVSDPGAPSFSEVVSIMGINQSLRQQWLDPGANRWCVIQSTAHQAGSEQRVLATPMTGAPATGDDTRHDPDQNSLPVRASSAVAGAEVWSSDRSSETATGTSIEDVTAWPPAVASIEEGGNHYLSTVRVERDPSGVAVEFGRDVPMESAARVVATRDHVLAIRPTGTGARLVSFDPDTGRREELATIDVDEPLELIAVR